MTRRQGLGLAAMTLVLAAANATAFAADPGVVATAPSGAGAPIVAAASGAPVIAAASGAAAMDATGSQIDTWVADDNTARPDSDGPAPRTIHGEISAGVGSNGYRNVSGVADIPVGQTGDVVVAASSTTGQIRGGRYGGFGYGALALGVYSSGTPACSRQPWAQAAGSAPLASSDCGSAAPP